MAALQSQYFGSAADVSVIFIQLLQDVVALVRVTGLMQGGELASRGAAIALAINQRRVMFAVEAGGGGVHDHEAVNHVAQVAHIALPSISLTHCDVIVR